MGRSILSKQDDTSLAPLPIGTDILIQPRENRGGFGVRPALRLRGPSRQLVEKSSLFIREGNSNAGGFSDRFVDGLFDLGIAVGIFLHLADRLAENSLVQIGRQSFSPSACESFPVLIQRHRKRTRR